MSEQGAKQVRSWLARERRFERMLEELRAPKPDTAQNGACPPPSD
jgi:hypothetical protein